MYEQWGPSDILKIYEQAITHLTAERNTEKYLLRASKKTSGFEDMKDKRVIEIVRTKWVTDRQQEDRPWLLTPDNTRAEFKQLCKNLIFLGINTQQLYDPDLGLMVYDKVLFERDHFRIFYKFKFQGILQVPFVAAASLKDTPLKSMLAALGNLIFNDHR